MPMKFMNESRTPLFRKALMVALAGWLAACSTMLETVYIPVQTAGWKFAGGSNRSHATVAEFVPTGESIDRWSKLLTIQFLEQETRPPIAIMETLKASMLSRCPGASWNVVKQDALSVLYEWKLASCPGNPDQHEIARLLQGKEGIHRIAYVEKTEAMDTATRTQWLNAFAQAYVERGGKKVVLTP
jgi:hypothetical protein